MTIRKGKDWGDTSVLRGDDPIVGTDHELATLFESRDGTVVGPEQVGLHGGDLARTVGAVAAADELRRGERTALPIDLGVVSIDGRDHVMAASLVIRRPRWSGQVTCVMNASFLGSWNVAPSGHPNDGRFDVVTATLSLSDRLKARSRLPNGTHVPHPDISIRRLKSGGFDLDRRARVWVDGVCLGSARRVSFAVCADAVRIII